MNNRGFTLIELLISVGLIAIFIPAIMKSLSFSLFASHQGEQYSQAYALAQEGMEAIYTIKSTGGTDWDWTSTPANTPSGYFYQPTISSGKWQLNSQTNTPAVTKAPFTRTVSIEPVERCVTAEPLIKEICIGGLVDQYTRKITISVSWPERGDDQEVHLEAYVTAH